MSIFQVAQVHNPRVVVREDCTLCGLVVFLSTGRGGRESSKGCLLASWEELCVSHALVVTTVPQEHRSIFEEVFNIIVADASLLLAGGPVTVPGLMELGYEVEDAL